MVGITAVDCNQAIIVAVMVVVMVIVIVVVMIVAMVEGRRRDGEFGCEGKAMDKCSGTGCGFGEMDKVSMEEIEWRSVRRKDKEWRELR